MKKQYRKNDLNLIEDDNLKLLVYKHPNLIDCQPVVSTFENVEIEYELVGTKLSELELKRIEKYELLYRMTKLKLTNLSKFEWSFNPENIYVDIDSSIRILERKLKVISEDEDQHQAVKEIKALVVDLLLEEDFEDSLAVDNKQLETSKELKALVEVKTLVGLEQELLRLLKKEKENYRTEKIVVDKKRHLGLLKNKMAYRLTVAILLLIIVFVCTYILPFEQKEIQLYSASQSGDTKTVLEISNNTRTGRFSKEEKLVIARAAINAQTELTTDQKENISGQLSVKSKEEILDYWVAIGNGQFEDANNYAIKLSDADMQIYALLMLVSEAENNDDLEAEERKQLIDDYESQIDDLKQKKQEISGEV